jgi:hypothetical protein
MVSIVIRNLLVITLIALTSSACVGLAATSALVSVPNIPEAPNVLVPTAKSDNKECAKYLIAGKMSLIGALIFSLFITRLVNEMVTSRNNFFPLITSYFVLHHVFKVTADIHQRRLAHTQSTPTQSLPPAWVINATNTMAIIIGLAFSAAAWEGDSLRCVNLGIIRVPRYVKWSSAVFFLSACTLLYSVATTKIESLLVKLYNYKFVARSKPTPITVDASPA